MYGRKRPLEQEQTTNKRSLGEPPFIGTKIPEPNEKDQGKFVPEWKQEVRDEQGRRRFHGAFTGGFSAGYFNTVGSKEGWTPSSFISSRQSRAQHQKQRIEDFMDQEDLEEMQQQIPKSKFYKYDSEQEKIIETMTSTGTLASITARIMEDLVVPIKDHIGIRLLKCMGWKQGESIGSTTQRVDTSTTLNEVSQLDRQRGEFYGLGYKSETSTRSVEKVSLKKALPMTNVYIHDDEDDIYQTSETKHFNTVLIDEEEEDRDTLWKPPVYTPKPTPKPKPQVTRKRLNYCQDGRLPLPGFHLSDQPLVMTKKFETLDVPDDFVPFHVFDTPGPDGLPPTPAPSIDMRSKMLGEERLKGPQRSVFDYVSKEDRERLEEMTGKSIKVENDRAPYLDPSLARIALQGFMPFTDDPNKQARYRRFLQVKAGEAKEYIPPPDKSMEEYEFHEFIQAARIFRPMSDQMASRFTRGQDSSSHQEENTTPPLEKKSPAEEAAKMNMFGTLTRTTTSFTPARLLCKRFQIPYSFN